jgi:galactoside O-acetyltransferase
MGFLSDTELNKMGFASLGRNVQISEKASIYNPHLIAVGSNVRIDDFAIVSPSKEAFEIGNYVHIAAHAILVGRAKIHLKDFSGLSGRVSIYSSTDDYSGKFLTNPTVPEEYTNVVSADVILGEHVIVGAGAVILPGVTIGKGSAVSAMSLVNKNLSSGIIAGGIPCRQIKSRFQDLFELEKTLNSKN